LDRLAQVILPETPEPQVIFQDKESDALPDDLVKEAPPIYKSLSREEDRILQQQHLDFFPNLSQRPGEPQARGGPRFHRRRRQYQHHTFHGALRIGVRRTSRIAPAKNFNPQSPI
jgi:hypothetical protein